MFKKLMLLAVVLGLSAQAGAATNRPSGFTTICKTDESCTVAANTNVAFGASGAFVYKVLSGNFVCSVATFGSDPIPEKSVKECSISSDGSTGTSSSASSSSSSSSSSVASGSIANGRYSIINRHSGLALEVSGAGLNDGDNIVQWEYWGGDNQNWDVASLGNGYYSVRAAHTGKSVDVYNFSMDPGGEIRQWEYWGSDNQQWAITSVGEGYFTISSRLNGFALDVWEWSAANGGDIRQWDTLGGWNQQWTFQATGVTSSSSSSASSSTNTGGVRAPYLEGFGAGTTGGAGGNVVYATTGTQINEAMCNRASDTTPLIIMVNGTITHGNTSKVSGSCDTTGEEIQFKNVSNISLIGVGNNAVLDEIGIHVRSASNIIIQNLHVMNVKKSGSPISNGGDAIGMESSVDRVWIDHNTLEASGGESDGYDSLLDMKAGVTNVTVSYNLFTDSSRAGLVGSSDSDDANDNITFHHNWYRNIEQRTPLLRHALAHTYNNYWSNPSLSYMFHAINSRMGARVLVEGNYFYNVNNPLLASDDSDEPGCWQTGENTVEPEIYYSRSVGDGALVIPSVSNGQLQSTCSVSVPYGYNLDNSADVPGIVSANAGVGIID